MNKKRIFLTVLALVLVCALSIMGTLAFLKANTTTVTNTFVAAGGTGPFIDEIKDPTTQEVIGLKFAIKEYDVDVAASGKYTLTEDEVDGIDYEKVMPGTTLPKEAFVKLSRTATQITIDGETTSTKEIDPAPAYLYLEVCGTSPVVNEVPVYTWAIDAANWVELKDAEGNAVVGPNGGKMYLYKDGSGAHVITDIAAYDDNYINIIEDCEVNVADVTLPDDTFKLEFNAFLSQASTGETDDPAAVFTTCFKN